MWKLSIGKILIQFNSIFYISLSSIYSKKKRERFLVWDKDKSQHHEKNELMTAKNMIMFTLIEVFTRLKLNSLPLQINNLHNAI